MGRLQKGDDLLSTLQGICSELGISQGNVSAIGAVACARIGYYDQSQRQYELLDLSRHLEILSLMGNVSLKDGEVFVHAHVVLGDESGLAYGGHLAEGTEVFACEFTIQELLTETPLRRVVDSATGLFLWAEDV
jgi:predicted DNA-binding protein with PD1-like motif